MGKYTASRINNAYSDWHYQKLNNRCYAADIDFIEVRGTNPENLKIKALFDLKKEGSLDKGLTNIARMVYKEIAKKLNVPIYEVYTSEEFKTFRVVRISDQFKYSEPNFSLPPDVCPYCRRTLSENNLGEFHCKYCNDTEYNLTEGQYIKWIESF